MDVTKLPFNEWIGLKHSDRSEYLLMLEDSPNYHNHLNTVHASAQFALAEATSGYFLLHEFSELTGVIPVVRKVELKYRKPVLGKVFSKAKFHNAEKNTVLDALNRSGRVLVNIEVSLFDSENNLIMQSIFEWFITR